MSTPPRLICGHGPPLPVAFKYLYPGECPGSVPHLLLHKYTVSVSFVKNWVMILNSEFIIWLYAALCVSRAGMSLQKKAVRELRIMFDTTAYFDTEQITSILMVCLHCLVYCFDFLF